MSSIRLTLFAGLLPSVDSKSLKSQNATIAHNTRLRDGAIRPFDAPLRITPFDHISFATPPSADINGIYRMPDTDCCCAGPVTFDCYTSIVELPTPGDCADYCHVVAFPCGCDCPQPYRYLPCDGKTCPLVVPRPRRKLITQVQTPGTAVRNHPYAGPDERSYTYTWVDKFSVESPPAMPTDPQCSYDDDVFCLTNFDPPPPNAVCVRIYRTSSFFEGGEDPDVTFATSYQLVEEVKLNTDGNGLPVAPTKYVDDRRLCDMDYGTLQTEMDCPPPCMDQVVATESGYLVGYKDNQIYVSERYEAHNWPEKNRLEIPDRITGIAVMYDFVFIGTTGRPYRMNTAFTAHNNTAEVTLDLVPYTENYPCLSRFAMVSTSFGALYPSHKGLIALAPTGTAKIISRNIIDEDDWDKWVPNIAAWHNGKYIAARSPQGPGWMLDVPDGAEGQPDLGTLITIDLVPDAIHSGRDGRLYFSYLGNLYAWNEDHSVLVYKWRSKVFTTTGHMQYGAIKVVGDYGTPVTLRVLCDGREYARMTIRDSMPRRLPHNGRGMYWQIEVEGTTRICEIHMATSITELSEGQLR